MTRNEDFESPTSRKSALLSTGSVEVATLIDVLGLLFWIVAPVLFSMRIFNRQNL